MNWLRREQASAKERVKERGNAPRRFRVQTSNRILSIDFRLAIVTVMVTLLPQLAAQTR